MTFSSVVFGVILIVFNLQTADASDWKYITADDGVRYYYSTSAFEKMSNHEFSVSIKEEYNGATDGIDEIILTEEINCYHSNYRNKSMSTHYVNKSIQTVNFGDCEWSNVEYGTNQFDIVAQVCSDAKISKPYLKVRNQ